MRDTPRQPGTDTGMANHGSLDDGNDSFVDSNPVTRGEAALYAFNMLQVTMVEYDSTSTIVVGDITINTSSSRKEVERLFDASRELQKSTGTTITGYSHFI